MLLTVRDVAIQVMLILAVGNWGLLKLVYHNAIST